MPVVFQLRKKGAEIPEKLQEVDDTMRREFGALPDEEDWFHDWYNRVGLSLALGKSFRELRASRESLLSSLDTYPPLRPEEALELQEFLRILDWLEENYEVSYWRQ